MGERQRKMVEGVECPMCGKQIPEIRLLMSPSRIYCCSLCCIEYNKLKFHVKTAKHLTGRRLKVWNDIHGE